MNRELNSDWIGKLKGVRVLKTESDEEDGVYSLLENGILCYRPKSFQVSLPICDWIDVEDSFPFSESDYIHDFGILSNMMWVLFQDDEEQWHFDCFCIERTSDDFLNGTGSIFSRELITRNDFCGAIYDQFSDELVFIMTDIAGMLVGMSQETDDLYDCELKFDVIKISMNDAVVKSSILKTIHCPFPCALVHDETLDSNKFYSDKSIWKIEHHDDKAYICYESLNDSVDRAVFRYYYDFSGSRINVETLCISINQLKTVHIDKPQEYGTDISFSHAPISGSCSVLVPDSVSFERQQSLLSMELSRFPQCLVDGVSRNLMFTPFSSKEDPLDGTFDIIAENIIGIGLKECTFRSILDRFDEIFDGVSDLDYLAEVKNQLEFVVNGFVANEKSLFESSENVFKPVFGKVDGMFTMDDIVYNIPCFSRCVDGEMKVVVWFENKTGVSMLQKYALDLDLSCWVNDSENSSRHVGYWGGYSGTKYLSWSGDKTAGEFETVGIKFARYFNDHPFAKTMKIDLGVCWHESSQIKFENVNISVFHLGIRHEMSINVKETSRKECGNRSVIMTVHRDTLSVDFESPHDYMLMTVNMKDKCGGWQDRDPDALIEFKNWTDSEFGGGVEWEEIESLPEFLFRNNGNNVWQFLRKSPVDKKGYSAAKSLLRNVFDQRKFLEDIYSREKFSVWANPDSCKKTLDAFRQGKWHVFASIKSMLDELK